MDNFVQSEAHLDQSWLFPQQMQIVLGTGSNSADLYL
jgi:hypothetical protein